MGPHPITPPAGGSAQGWKPGDLAECINTGPWYRGGIEPIRLGPVYGEVRMVRGVRLERHPLDGKPVEVLEFNEWPGARFSAGAFRKITPRADEAVAHDAQFLDRWLPAREAA